MPSSGSLAWASTYRARIPNSYVDPPHSTHTPLTPSQDTLRYENAGDIIGKTTWDNTCVFYLTGQPDAKDDSHVTVSTWLKCGDDAKQTGTWDSPKVTDTLSFTDDRVGTITVTFKQDSTSRYPFPGDAIIANDQWHSKGWGDSIPFQNCMQLSSTGQIESKDCNGMYSGFHTI